MPCFQNNDRLHISQEGYGRQIDAIRKGQLGPLTANDLKATAEKMGCVQPELPGVDWWNAPLPKDDGLSARQSAAKAFSAPGHTDLMVSPESIDAFLEANTPPDIISRPAHYARYAIEPITFIMANSLPFCVGNVVKYVLRYDAKNGREDLMKAKRYIEMIIEDMDRKANGTETDVVGRPL